MFSSSDSDSDIEDDTHFLLLCELLKQKKKRRYWVHPINKIRESKGEYHSLVAKELAEDEERFQTYFKLNKNQFEEIHSMIEGDIKKIDSNFRKAIGTRERLGVCLKFLCTGNSFRSIAFSYRMGFSTVQEIVEEVCEAIWKNMAAVTMPSPTESTWTNIANDFATYWNFPNCIGSLDGKHINIICPINAGTTFYNYKKQHSIVLLALVDATYKFILIDVGGYGRNSDGGIFEKSLIRKMLEQKALNIPRDRPLSNNSEPLPHVIVADAAFPLKPYLLKPYSKSNLNNNQNKIFNYRLSRARRTVENAFGILRSKWRVFQGPLQVQPKMADKIVSACCCLHNYLRIQTPDTYTTEEISFLEESNSLLQNLDAARRNPTQNAVYVREKFKQFFNSSEGQVPWQWDKINVQRN